MLIILSASLGKERERRKYRAKDLSNNKFRKKINENYSKG